MAVLSTGYKKNCHHPSSALSHFETQAVWSLSTPWSYHNGAEGPICGEYFVVIDGDFKKSLNRCDEDKMLSSKLQKLKSGNVNFIIHHPELLKLDTIKQLFKQEPVASKGRCSNWYNRIRKYLCAQCMP